MALLINNSVGDNGVNNANDVIVIQSALNQVRSDWGGPQVTLNEDGIADDSLNRAIRKFQLYQLGFEDGRVDPNFGTVYRLGLVMNDPGIPLPWNPPPDIASVKLWINAFIPGDLPGITQILPAGAHAGSSVIPGPLLGAQPFGVSDCFMTDQRSFDANVHASSRMHSECEVDVRSNLILAVFGPSIALEWHNCDFTIEVDCEDGDEECRDQGETGRMAFSNLRITSSTSFAVDYVGAANNPCYAGSPDIDCNGTFSVELSERTVLFNGHIDAFPAFEAYATANGGAGTALFCTPPAPGNTPANLFGDAVKYQFGRATI